MFSLSPTRTLCGLTMPPPSIYAHMHLLHVWTEIPESTPANPIKNNYYAAEKKMPGIQNEDSCYLHTSLIEELSVTLPSVGSNWPSIVFCISGIYKLIIILGLGLSNFHVKSEYKSVLKTQIWPKKNKKKKLKNFKNFIVPFYMEEVHIPQDYELLLKGSY